jgi:uncharacterized protein
MMPDFPPGTPGWVDIASPNLEASREFYGKLFGWESQIGGPEMGGYTVFMKNGKMVAGGAPTMSPEQPPAWSTYVITADADTTAQKVRDAGGQVIMGPMDVMDIGRMAVFNDTEGAFINVWQPGTHKGAELVNEPGSFGWNELETRNVEGAKAFYGKVFGWGADTHDMPGGMSYTEWKLDGKSIGGAMDITNMMPAEVPPHWLVYFVVEDADAGVAKVQELGGQQISPPMDIEPGRFAIVRDPQGAAFALFSTKKSS